MPHVWTRNWFPPADQAPEQAQFLVDVLQDSSAQALRRIANVAPATFERVLAHRRRARGNIRDDTLDRILAAYQLRYGQLCDLTERALGRHRLWTLTHGGWLRSETEAARLNRLLVPAGFRALSADDLVDVPNARKLESAVRQVYRGHEERAKALLRMLYHHPLDEVERWIGEDHWLQVMLTRRELLSQRQHRESEAGEDLLDHAIDHVFRAIPRKAEAIKRARRVLSHDDLVELVGSTVWQHVLEIAHRREDER